MTTETRILDDGAIAWFTADKSSWGEGPWQREPDKVQWIDPATGLDCLVVRGPVGALCGYVGVPPQHPWHGIDYSNACTLEQRCSESYCHHSPDNLTEGAHGGLTFSGACREGAEEGHGICHVPQQPGRPEPVWWFGFDCAHLGDLAPGMDRRYQWDNEAQYRDLDYVRTRVASLAAELAQVQP